ncbi:hypothetical protein CONLIGDRAFT_626347 [Coniochaeta ligniaria NRRL 30616]|uniref:DUF7730 domain-containing protein n=1 Tax=Coniochaeta ligniaria NRRL 30616 TaxID=1408157 RepID=A0A1J7J4E2_9PEZI|nr:hypothetical protein CONLIGDRAFT_626347 [Coniochaeta ligniaria NRRL 30616]
MDWLRDAFQRLSAHHQDDEPEPAEPPSHGHALASLPNLPSPRRPITPIPANPQLESTFFKLPPELRQQIYRLLLSGRTLHIDMRYTAAETSTPHSTKGVHLSPTRRWRWRASTCHRHPSAQAISDRCGWGGPPPTACDEHSTPCGIGKEALGLLLCCRLAYREAVQILYAENTFHTNTGALLLFTDRLLPPERSGAITSLIYQVTPESVLTYSEEHLGLQPGMQAVMTLLSRIPKAFPGLKRLHIVIDDIVVRGVWPGLRDLQLPMPFETQSRVNNMLLSPADLVVTLYQGRLKEFVLIMDHRAFDRLVADQSAAADRVESVDGKYLQFWKRVAVPHVGRKIDKGYWVRRVSPDDENWSVQFSGDTSLLETV